MAKQEEGRKRERAGAGPVQDGRPGRLRSGRPCRLVFALAMISGCVSPADEEPPCQASEVLDSESALCVPERCGPGPWPAVEIDDDAMHVAPWGSGDGDGSADRPFESIQDAADEGSEQILVAAGVYLENLLLSDQHEGLRITGRCAELSEIDGSDEEAPAVYVNGGGIAVEGVTVTGGTLGVVVWGTGPMGYANADLQNVDIARNRAHGLAVFDPGSSATLRSCRVLETLPEADGTMGRGISLEDGATLVASDLLLEGNADNSLFMYSAGTSADIEDVTIRDTQPRVDGSRGRGIGVQSGASLVARRLLVERSAEIGIFALGAGTSVDLEDATVRDTRPQPSDRNSRGVCVEEGANLSARGLLVEGSRDIGILVVEAGAVVDLEDATVRGTLPREDGRSGRGLEIHSGAALSARRMLVEDNTDVGLIAASSGTSVDLEDVTIRRTLPLADGTFASGLYLQGGAALVARGLDVSGNGGLGLGVLGVGTSVTLEGASIVGTLQGPDGTLGHGIEVNLGASLVASDVLVEENCEVGFIAGSGAAVELRDVTIRDTQPRADGLAGHGLDVNQGARLSATNLLLEGNREAGIIAGLPETVVELHDTVVRDTAQNSAGLGGTGIQAVDGARLLAWDLLLEGNQTAGLVVADEGTHAELVDATIRGTRASSGSPSTRGIDAHSGSRLVASRLLLDGNESVGLIASSPGTFVSLKDVQILGTRAGTVNSDGIGILSQREATVEALGLEVRDCDGPGLYLTGRGAIRAWDAVLDGNGFGGVAMLGGALSLHGGSVSRGIPHPSEGGGVGVFVWYSEDWWDMADVELDGVAFSGLPGPALYLRGPGRYVMRGCEVWDSGTPPWLPGGVLAVEGVQDWQDETGAGLLLAGNEFVDLAGDAVLLDFSSATLDADPATGAPNLFLGVSGEPLRWQRCGDLASPEILDGSLPDPTCTSVPQQLGPLLEYNIWLEEGLPQE